MLFLTRGAKRASRELTARAPLAGALLISIALLVPAQSIFWAPHVPQTLKLGMAALLVLSAVRPGDALLVVAALSPLGWMLTTRVFGAYPARVTEAIVLAFLAGYAVHLFSRRFKREASRAAFDPPARLLAPAFLFGVVAIASCLVVYRIAQVWHDHPWPYFQRFIAFLARDFHDSLGHYDPTAATGGFGFFVSTALMMEGVALFLVAFAFSRDAVYRRRLTAMTVAGAAGAGALSFVALAMAAVSELGISATWPELFARRWSMFTPKLNTAASLFVLTAPLAFGAAASREQGRIGWLAAGSLIVAALWINGTRAALLAAIVVLAGIFAWLASRRLTAQLVKPWAIAGVSLLVLGLVATTYQRLSESVAVTYALSTRRMFTQTAINMFASQPLFGVGIGQYYLLSERFAPSELFEVSSLFRRAQAHNAFLQVAAELGVVGLITFVWMIGAALWIIAAGLRKRPHDAVLLGAAGGITAFLLTTASSGHPLLLEVTAYPFWIVLGLAAGWAFHGSADRVPSPTEAVPAARPARSPATAWGWSVVAVAAAILLASVPVRVEREMRGINFANITYGTHGGWRKSTRDLTHVWTSERATIFLEPRATDVEIPLRALFARYTGPVTVEMYLNGRVVERTTLTDSAWRWVRLSLPPESRRYLQLDLRVSPTWSSPDAPPGTPDTRAMGVMVGELRAVAQAAR